jgi:hypothetical protein
VSTGGDVHHTTTPELLGGSARARRPVPVRGRGWVPSGDALGAVLMAGAAVAERFG